ncbi:hypothetical protein ANRL4_01731 [Anaerolineae bacterium]|nr:hypothetical protein ANRL4_01731 [Anaerolineae bacterium]
MKLPLTDLRVLSQKLLDYLEAQGHETLDLSQEYYWHIPKEAKYDQPVPPSPEVLSLGQLSFDWENLHSLLEGKNDPIGYDLVWLAAILRALGESIT